MKHSIRLPLLVLLLSAPLAFDTGAAEKPRPNIIFILVDDLGWTDLGCMGSDLYETPHIDRLASQGLRFIDAYAACPVCSPTRAAVMTGKYPARLHLTDWIPGHSRPDAPLAIPAWTQYLSLEEATVAEALQAAGYATCHIGKWHLGGEAYWPDKQGFDINLGGCDKGQPPSYFSPYRIPTLKDGPAGEYLTDRLGDEACQFIEANRDRPFFLYLPHYCVHTPLQAKKPLVEYYERKIKQGMRHNNAVYAAMIHSLDETVGRVLAKLEELRLTDRTIIFFTSDNGGLISDPKRPITSNVPLRAGKGSAYEGGVRVPLIIRWPGVTAAGSTSAEPVLSVDYYPTILEMTRAPREPLNGRKVDGQSIVPVLKQPKNKLERDAIYWHYPHYHPGGATPFGAVRARDWKLVEFYEDRRVELYHLSADIGETNDLAGKMPAKVSELRQKLQWWRQSVHAQMPTPARK